MKWKSMNLEYGIPEYKLLMPQLLAISIKNFLLFGYTMTVGFPTIVIPSLQGDQTDQTNGFSLTNSQISWFSSINLLCVPIGCLFSGYITDKFGRKKSLLLVTFPLVTAWILLHFSRNLSHLYFGLGLGGLSGGMLDTPAHIYTGEITQPRYRGILAATGTFWVILGVTSQFFMGIFWHWRTVALINCTVPSIAFILICIIPESPYWLIQNFRYDDAKKSFAWLRGWVKLDKIQAEFEMVRQHLENDNEIVQKSEWLETLRNYKSSHFFIPFSLVCFAFFISHFCGLTPLQTYAILIFKILQIPIDEYIATFLLGLAQLLGGMFCIIFVHSMGKRPIVFGSTIGCGLCFLVSSFIIHYMDIIADGGTDTNVTVILHHYTLQDQKMSGKLVDLNNSTMNNTIIELDSLMDSDIYKYWISLILLLSGAIFASGGIIILPWVLISEVFPTSVRSGASGLSIGIGHIFAFLANKIFLDMTSYFTLPGTFGFYAFISLMGTLILYFVLPETEGRSLQEIESHYTGGPKLTERKISTAQIGYDCKGHNKDEFL